jgi:hypothetical protein
MNWYISKLVFEIAIADSPLRQYDVQYRLVQAGNADEALEHTFALGREEDVVFVNTQGQAVSWHFTGVATLQQLGVLAHGALLVSESIENCAAAEISALLKFRAPLASDFKEEPCVV